MKKSLILIICLISLASNAQLRDDTLNSIDVSGGYAENGYGVNLSYNLYFSKSRKNNYLQLSGLYTSGKIEKQEFEINYQLFSVNAGFYYNLPLDTRDKISFNAGGGLTGGIERLNDGKEALPTGALLSTTGGFVFGPYVGGDLEIALSTSISFLIKANGFYHINSEIGDFTIFAGGGLRFFL